MPASLHTCIWIFKKAKKRRGGEERGGKGSPSFSSEEKDKPLVFDTDLYSGIELARKNLVYRALQKVGPVHHDGHQVFGRQLDQGTARTQHTHYEQCQWQEGAWRERNFNNKTKQTKTNKTNQTSQNKQTNKQTTKQMARKEGFRCSPALKAS